MNTGVLILPWSVSRTPVRALYFEDVVLSVNFKKA
tara:strand:- start:437 stop:541 length:105 start_codon:yes stop_codon:yes gene_type:complete